MKRDLLLLKMLGICGGFVLELINNQKLLTLQEVNVSSKSSILEKNMYKIRFLCITTRYEITALDLFIQ